MPIFKLHIPFLDEMKEKGVKTALVEKADEIFTRITAGLPFDDLRGALRGDPPGRPNKRLKPHAEGFWLHMKPTYYHQMVDGFYPTFRLGWLSTFFGVFEIITGVFLMVYYTPSPLVAYENMLDILSNVPFGRLMRDMHRLGAELMVIVVALHMLRTFVTGSYKKPRQFTWVTGIVLLLVTLVLSFSEPVFQVSPIVWAAFPILFLAVLCGLGFQAFLWAGKADTKWIVIGAAAATALAAFSAGIVVTPFAGRVFELTAIMYGLAAAALWILLALIRLNLRWPWFKWAILTIAIMIDLIYSARYLIDKF